MPAAVTVHGLRALQLGLRAAGGEAEDGLRRGLRAVGGVTLAEARSGAPVGPRPKRSDTPPLAASLRLSVTQRGVSVYSNAAHAGVQNFGGRVGHGAVITGARASHYMTKAARAENAALTARMELLLAQIERASQTG